MTQKLSTADRLLRLNARASLRAPAPVLRLIAGKTRVNERGVSMDLHTQVLTRLDDWFGEGDRADSPSIEVARENYVRSLLLAEEPLRDIKTEDQKIPDGPPVRVYHPNSTSKKTLIYLHGGGWALGNLRAYDAVCRRISDEGNLTVVSVDYALAPENPFPAGLSDVRAAWDWTLGNYGGDDPTNVMVGGDSAGGNLSAALCIMLRDEGQPQPERQVLLYPGLDMTRSHASHQEFSDGPILSYRDTSWFLDHYAAPPTDPLASPLFVEDTAGLAPAIVATAGWDPLRDEGEAYVERLKDGGVTVHHIDAAGLIHGFVNMTDGIPEAARVVSEIITLMTN